MPAPGQTTSNAKSLARLLVQFHGWLLLLLALAACRAGPDPSPPSASSPSDAGRVANSEASAEATGDSAVEPASSSQPAGSPPEVPTSPLRIELPSELETQARSWPRGLSLISDTDSDGGALALIVDNRLLIWRIAQDFDVAPLPPADLGPSPVWGTICGGRIDGDEVELIVLRRQGVGALGVANLRVDARGAATLTDLVSPSDWVIREAGARPCRAEWDATGASHVSVVLVGNDIGYRNLQTGSAAVLSAPHEGVATEPALAFALDQDQGAWVGARVAGGKSYEYVVWNVSSPVDSIAVVSSALPTWGVFAERGGLLGVTYEVVSPDGADDSYASGSLHWKALGALLEESVELGAITPRAFEPRVSIDGGWLALGPRVPRYAPYRVAAVVNVDATEEVALSLDGPLVEVAASAWSLGERDLAAIAGLRFEEPEDEEGARRLWVEVAWTELTSHHEARSP